MVVKFSDLFFSNDYQAELKPNKQFAIAIDKKSIQLSLIPKKDFSLLNKDKSRDKHIMLGSLFIQVNYQGGDL